MKIEQHKYLSDEKLESLEDESLSSGYHFIDTLGLTDIAEHQKFFNTIR